MQCEQVWVSALREWVEYEAAYKQASCSQRVQALHNGHAEQFIRIGN